MSQSDVRPDSPLVSSFERIRRELDRWWDTAVSQGGKALDAIGLRGGRGFTPSVDVVETPEEVRVYVDVPGVDPQSIDVTVAGNMLALKGEAPEPPRDEHDELHVHERNHGPFSRAIPMPTPVDAESVTAEAKDGILCVKLGKVERARTRQIPVHIGGGTGP